MEKYKEEYIETINNLLKRFDDMELFEIVYQLLFKSIIKKAPF